MVFFSPEVMPVEEKTAKAFFAQTSRETSALEL